MVGLFWISAWIGLLNYYKTKYDNKKCRTQNIKQLFWPTTENVIKYETRDNMPQPDFYEKYPCIQNTFQTFKMPIIDCCLNVFQCGATKYDTEV